MMIGNTKQMIDMIKLISLEKKDLQLLESNVTLPNFILQATVKTYISRIPHDLLTHYIVSENELPIKEWLLKTYKAEIKGSSEHVKKIKESVSYIEDFMRELKANDLKL